MKRYLSFFVMMAFSLSVEAVEYTDSPLREGTSSGQELSLQNAIMLAFENDPSIARTAAEISISDAQIDEAKSAWRPQVSLQGGMGGSASDGDDFAQSDNYGLALRQLLYDFGQTSNNVDQYTAMQEGKRYELQSALNDVGGRTARVYVEIKRFEALKRVVNDGIASLTEVRNIAAMRAEGGLGTHSDLLQTESRIAALRSQQAQYDAQLASARAELGVLTGTRINGVGDVPAVLTEVEANLDAINYEQIPQVLQAEASAEVARLAIEGERKGYMPSFSLEGGRTHYDSDDDSYWDNSIQVTVDAPLYQGGSVGARVRQAEGNVAASQADINKVKQDILLKAAQAESSMSGASGRLVAAEQQLQSARRSREVYRDEYLLGQRSVNDLLSNEQEVYQARVAQQSALYDQWQSAVVYRTSVHQLLPTLGLDRPETKLSETW